MTSGSRIRLIVLLLLLTLVVGVVRGDDAQCSPGSKSFDKSASQSGASINKGVEQWKGFLLIAAFGIFGLFISVFFRILRRCLYDDGHLLDTFFDAGGDVNFAKLALSVVGRWFWTAGFTWSTASVYRYGLVGQYWHAGMGGAVLLLFTMAAFEIRLKAPGAKTVLQVVSARFGTGPHVVLLIFTLTLSVILGSAILMEASRILNSLTQDASTTSLCAVIALSVCASSLIAGVGGNVYMSFFTSLLVSGISLTYIIHTFKNRVQNSGGSDMWGDEARIYGQTCGVAGGNGTKDSGLMTFHSRSGLMEGVLIILCGITNVFVNQSFWTGAVLSKPIHTVWGYITGALAWFSLPFMLALSFGFAYWSLAAEAGKHLVTPDQVRYGYLAVFTSQQLLGNLGDYLFYSLTLAATVSSVSSEVLSITSLLVYDIYQQYIGPRLSVSDASCPNSVKVHKYWHHLRNIDSMKYLLVIAVSFIQFAVALILIAIDIDFPWLYKFLGVICGSAVFPLVASVGWYRTRAVGVFLGPILGLACGLVTWLVYAGSFPGGLTKFRENTGRQEVFIAGAAMSVGTGALTTIILSWFCGSCNPHIRCNSNWAKTRLIDNPLRPWALRYGGVTPDFHTLRAILRPAELIAYSVAPMLAVGAVFVWPALMLLAKHFTLNAFKAWVWVAILWGGIAAGLLAIFALLLWIVQICCYGTCTIEDDGGSVVSEESFGSHRHLTGVRYHNRRPASVRPVGVVTQPPVMHTHVIAAPPPVVTAPAPQLVSRYVSGAEVRGLATSVDYVRQPVTRYHTHQYDLYGKAEPIESEINYELSGDKQQIKTTINLD